MNIINMRNYFFLKKIIGGLLSAKMIDNLNM